MPSLVKQSSTQLALKFFLTESSDHITGLTGATPTVTISKAGAAFATPSGAVTEMTNGWYQVAGNATDTNTLGEIALHATATSADPFDGIVAQVVAFDPQSATLGLSLPAVDGSGNVALQADQTVNAAKIGGTAQTGADIGALLGTPAGASVSADIAAVKTDTAAVKTKTDSLTFTVSGVVDANVADWKGSAAPAMPTNFADLSIDTDGNVSITANVKKNTAKSGFMFVMTDSTNHTPATGLTVSATRSLDGAAFAACANAVSEVANGTYAIDLAAADTNGDHVMLRFTATGADDLNIEIITQP